MPLSKINKVQAQSINDLGNYLMAKSYNFGDSDRKIQSASKGEHASDYSGTPVLNLLNEFKAMTNQEEQKTSSFNPNITQTSTNTSGFNLNQVVISPMLHPSVPTQERIFKVPIEFEMTSYFN
jgi:hypothetical protein